MGAAEGRSPLLLSSAHSGTHMPAEFLRLAQLPVAVLRRMEDAHVHHLLAHADAPVLAATHARAMLDLNRAEDEYDPQMFIGQPDPPPRITERVRAGFGVIPRIVGPGHVIHGGRMPAEILTARLGRLHRPFHAALAAALARAREAYGFAVLLDCHSMPDLGPGGPDIVLGNRYGGSATTALSAWIRQEFLAAGLNVAMNHPYAGGYITASHGRPASSVHVVQIEMARTLYMDPNTLAPHDGFTPLAAVLAAMVRRLLRALDEELAPALMCPARRDAAE